MFNEELLKKLLVNEGTLSVDNDDAGGLTLFGVAYNKHPKRINWDIVISKIVETGKKYNITITEYQLKRLGRKGGVEIYIPKAMLKELNSYFEKHSALKREITAFYKLKFWDKINGDNIISQSFAESLFDFSVNTGVKGRMVFQKALGITVDGIYGSGTAREINKRLCKDALGLHLLLFRVKMLRYLEITPYRNNRKYIFGWSRRAYNCLFEEVNITKYLLYCSNHGIKTKDTIFLASVKTELFSYKKHRNLNVLVNNLNKAKDEL